MPSPVFESPRLVSVSRRTDVLAWYTPWFLNALERGYCRVFNPFNPKQTRRVALTPEAVAGFVFWTRWPAPLLPYLDRLESRGTQRLYLISVLDLPAALEPHPVPLAQRLEAIQELSRREGRERIVWRYDPILLSDTLSPDFHVDRFRALCQRLASHVRRVVLSLVDPYRKTVRRLSPLQAEFGTFRFPQPDHPQVLDLVQQLAQTARSQGVEPVACCEPAWEALGIPAAPCVDGEWFAEQGACLATDAPDSGQRESCRCSASIDIGVNDSCVAGCSYCYATGNPEKALRRFHTHDPGNEFLFAPP